MANRPPLSPRPTTGSPASRPTSTGIRTTILRLVGGKGGVGKTTCAAAIAVAAARAGRRTFVVSTDPAPSLGDALGVPLGPAPRRVPVAARADGRGSTTQRRRGMLHALELDSRRAFGRWLAARREGLETIALRGTWLDRADVRALLDLSLPGLDEVASLLEIVRLARDAPCDELVVDTAPTGHTLRLIATPDALAGVGRVLDAMQARHREIVQALRGRWIADDADALIAEMQADANAAREILSDSRRTDVTIVTLPEPMAVEETLDAVRALADRGIVTSRLVINRLTPSPPSSCPWCSARRRGEWAAVDRLRKALELRAPGAGPAISSLHAREREPIGATALAALGSEILAPTRMGRPSGRSTVRATQRAPLPAEFHGPWTTPVSRLLMFGGKGGVGKTTCAAAAALNIAASRPAHRLLLVSTDPAHSLGDVLGIALSDTPRTVPGTDSLHARELDAARAFDEMRRRYAEAIEAVFDRLAKSAVDAAHDRRVMLGLLDLAPPGLDEMAAAIELVELLEQNGHAGYGTIVVDTAPTGHALRLMQMPETLQAWTKALMGILLKYQPVVGLGRMGEALLRLSRGLGKLRLLLMDPASTAFVIVTRAAELPLAETRRLLPSLQKLQVPTRTIVVNAAGAGTCARCRRSAAREQRMLRELDDARNRRLVIVLAPSTVPPPHGPAVLAAWGRTWRTKADGRPRRAERL